MHIQRHVQLSRDKQLEETMKVFGAVITTKSIGFKSMCVVHFNCSAK